MTLSGQVVLDFIRVAEDFVPDGWLMPVGRAALFGRDGVAWYWELEEDWIGRGRPDPLTLTITMKGGPSGRPTAPPTSLAVVTGEPPARVDIGPEGIVVGRDPGCDLVLDDEYMSSRHARIYWDGPQLRLEDAGSTNGVYLNGHRTYQAPLTTGDRIRAGQSVLEVVASPAPPEGQAPA